MTFFVFQPEVPTKSTGEVPTIPTDEVPSSKSKPETIIKYRIEKDKTIPDVNVNPNLQEIINQIDDHVKKQNLEKLNEIDDDIQEEEEKIEIPLTPEMEHANTLYHQAMKLINGTTNRQYET